MSYSQIHTSTLDGHPITMWNDTDIAIAHLITFRCYGTWLHGDDRGSVDRFQNQYQSPYIEPNKQWREYNAGTLKRSPVLLDSGQRESVECAIKETCRIRDWLLQAINVRTNHVHVVVSIGEIQPGRALNALKANSTRQMRKDGRWPHERSPWAERGSNRYLWNERSVERAIDYVINGQGGPLPDFDAD
jgi:REP element-mobilizing transposase RayT